MMHATLLSTAADHVPGRSPVVPLAIGRAYRLLLCLALMLSLPQGGAVAAALDQIRVIPLPSETVIPDRDSAPHAGSGQEGIVAARLHGALQSMRARRSATSVAHGPRSSANAIAGSLRPLLGRSPAATGQPAQGGLRLEVHMRGIGTPRLIRGGLRADGSRPPVQPAAGVAAGPDDDAAARRFLSAFRDYLRLDDPEREMHFSSKQEDELGYRHLRYGQRYRGLPVWPAGLTVHVDRDGNVASVSGGFVPTPRSLDSRPKLNAAHAERIARRRWPDGRGSVDGPALIVYAPLDRAPRLAWKMRLLRSLRDRWLVVVDAADGKVLAAYNEVEEAGVTGSGTDLFDTQRELHLWLEGGTYYMNDTSKNMFDAARSNPPQAKTTRGAIIVQDARNQPPTSNPESPPRTVVVASGNANDGWVRDAVSAAFGFSKTYDYYLERHGRNSVDGAGGNILGVVRLGQGFDNAFWASDLGTMFFGDAQPFAGALDVVAHELTHGVTSYTANLVYQGQSGALNEAFSDIFGEMVEAYAEGSNDWLMGTRLSQPVRNMKTPSALEISPGLPYPEKMSQYVRTTRDNGGVHMNSGIINHAFYLLAEGLDQAIGRVDAERIFYRALAFHLTQSAQFADARLACIQSAEELFGAGSAQAGKVAEAFDAVEVFNPTTPTGPVGTPIAVGGADAVLFVYFDSARGAYFLGRREAAQGDEVTGTMMSSGVVRAARPSVSANGGIGIFVNGLQDACLIDTRIPLAGEECLGIYQVHSAVIAPDGENFAFVMLDDAGNASNEILAVNAKTKSSTRYKLVAPGTEGVNVSSVVRADVMSFTSNGRFLIYDALNAIGQDDGTQVEAWSIYAIDLALGQTLILVPPVLGANIGNPAVGNLSDDLLTFETQEPDTGKTSVLVTRLSTGQTGTIAETVGTAAPVFSGDDAAVVFAAADSDGAVRSLYRQPLSEDRVAPAGGAALWLADADFGVVYRRSARFKLAVKAAGAGSGRVLSQPQGIECGYTCAGLYPKGTRLRLTASPDFGSRFVRWKGACSGGGGCKLKMTRRRAVTAVFRPRSFHRLTVTKIGDGRVVGVPAGIDCGEVCSASHDSGRVITLTAEPGAGSRFLGWGGACAGTAVCRVKMTRTRNVSARFESS